MLQDFFPGNPWSQVYKLHQMRPDHKSISTTRAQCYLNSQQLPLYSGDTSIVSKMLTFGGGGGVDIVLVH